MDDSVVGRTVVALALYFWMVWAGINVFHLEWGMFAVITLGLYGSMYLVFGTYRVLRALNRWASS